MAIVARGVEPRVAKLLKELEARPLVGVQQFKLSDAVRHIASADGGRLQALVAQCGAPDFYHDVATTEKRDTFQSLCRIIVGQQLAGAAVKAIWAKFIAALGDDVTAITPAAVLAEDLETMRKSAGLSNAKARAIADLAAHYSRGELSDAILLDPSLSAADLTAKLTAVKGVGPWSANMYQMFSLHLPDVFPTGDLGVRNGIAKVFKLKGAGKSGQLDEKKDKEKFEAAFAPYKPYRSLASWYMWRALETPSFME